MVWSFWLFLAVVVLCVAGLIAQARHYSRAYEISDKRYRELVEQIGVTQRNVARMARVVKPVVIKVMGEAKAQELLQE